MLDRIIISQLNNKHAQLWWVIISECSFWNTKLSWGSSRSRRDCFYLSDFRKKWNAKENGIQRRQQQTYFPICSKRLQSQNYFINSAIKKDYSGRRRNFVFFLSLSELLKFSFFDKNTAAKMETSFWEQFEKWVGHFSLLKHFLSHIIWKMSS